MMTYPHPIGLKAYSRHLLTSSSNLFRIFFYVLKREREDFVEYGVGYETTDELQLRHWAQGTVKRSYINWFIAQIHHGGISLDGSKLKFITEREDIYFTDEEREIFARMFDDVHRAGWPKEVVNADQEHYEFCQTHKRTRDAAAVR